MAYDIYNGKAYEKCSGVRPGKEIQERIYRILDVEQPNNIYSPEDQFCLNSNVWRKISKAYQKKITHLDFTLPVLKIDEGNLLDRFEFFYSQQEVETDTLNEFFVSIIIDAQSKSQIRKELQSIL